jgi:hypothetical protein
MIFDTLSVWRISRAGSLRTTSRMSIAQVPPTSPQAPPTSPHAPPTHLKPRPLTSSPTHMLLVYCLISLEQGVRGPQPPHASRQNRLKKKLASKSSHSPDDVIFSDDESRSSDSKRSKTIGSWFGRRHKPKTENVKVIKSSKSKPAGNKPLHINVVIRCILFC